jgi:hypothetical protein
MTNSKMRFTFNGQQMALVEDGSSHNIKIQEHMKNNCLIVDVPKIKLNPFVGILYTLGLATFTILATHLVLQMMIMIPAMPMMAQPIPVNFSPIFL